MSREKERDIHIYTYMFMHLLFALYTLMIRWYLDASHARKEKLPTHRCHAAGS